MAEDVKDPQPAAEEQPAVAAPTPERELELDVRPPRRSATDGVLTTRFRLIYAVLAVLLGAGIGGFLVLADGPGDVTGPAWSAWQPDGSAEDRARAIAEYVSGRYRLESQHQLVAVTVTQPPTVQQQPVRFVALRNSTSADDIDVMSADNTMAYVLCGIPAGQNCSIQEGEPSPERGILLRREAFELALYTFKYVDGVDSVVAFLPPREGQDQRFALFFRKDDVEDALDRPLEYTLPPRAALTPSSLNDAETSAVGRYVDPHLFEYSFGQAGDGSIFLQLVPPAL